MFEPFITRALAPHVPLAPAQIQALLTPPPSPDLGDIAFPCFALAKALRQAPNAIAAALAAQIRPTAPIASVTAAGAYVNFHLDRAEAGAQLLREVLTQPDTWGGSTEGAGQTVCVDFCSPNVARRM
ncbi:MAG TPA: arginine--tRNA ligase, partial [Symbiobacteriaceae bacterium]|nr:arginine--tRNA ligase [Symbiobacteriaceae bacterium]